MITIFAQGLKINGKEGYLLSGEFAEAYALSNLENRIRLGILRDENKLDECLKLSNVICENELKLYLNSLWQRARCISIYGNERKDEAISAWRDLEGMARYSHSLFGSRLTMNWVIEALSGISNDYIAISEFEKALDTIEELTSFGIEYYNYCKENGDDKINKILSDIKDGLRNCYSWCFPTEDNVIANDPRFKKCEERLARLE